LSEGVIGALSIARATALRLLQTRVKGRPLLSSWDALGDYLQAAMSHSHDYVIVGEQGRSSLRALGLM
jgi:DNA repair protein RadC